MFQIGLNVKKTNGSGRINDSVKYQRLEVESETI